jgi:hypothetical protein
MKEAGACCAGLNHLVLHYQLFKLMTKLSPTAQAVLDAVREICPAPADEIAAVALRAAADQVAPDDYESFTGHYDWDSGLETRNNSIREGLLCIADELEQLND